MYENRKPGYAVAPPGRSAHNYGSAYDIAIYDAKGRYIPNGTDRNYQIAATVGKGLGLVWGADVYKPKDYDHFELVRWQSRR